MAKKGQGISINVIVIAAIALLILVILSTLVIRSGGTVNRGTQCEPTGGTCVADYDETGQCDPDLYPDYTRDMTKGCEERSGVKYICCRKV